MSEPRDHRAMAEQLARVLFATEEGSVELLLAALNEAYEAGWRKAAESLWTLA